MILLNILGCSRIFWWGYHVEFGSDLCIYCIQKKYSLLYGTHHTDQSSKYVFCLIKLRNKHDQTLNELMLDSARFKWKPPRQSQVKTSGVYYISSTDIIILVPKVIWDCGDKKRVSSRRDTTVTLPSLIPLMFYYWL